MRVFRIRGKQNGCSATTTRKDILVGALESGRMHHAWLISGREGIGKATLAYQFAVFALAARHERLGLTDFPFAVGPGSVSATQVRSLSHPGLLVIRRSYDIKNKRFPTAISVDEVRRLRGFLSHKSESDGWRVVIVDQADELNVNAANALLKSLEEPPARTVFLLITTEPGRLLPTIRSRCRSLSLGGIRDEDVRLAAEAAMAKSQSDRNNSEIDWAAITGAAGGSVRRALVLAGGDSVEFARFIDRFLRDPRRADWNDCHAMAERLAGAQAQQDFELFLTLFTERLADAIRIAARGTGDENWPMQLMPGRTLARWVELWETVQRGRRDNQALNLDRAAFLLNTMLRVGQLAEESGR